MLLFFLYIPLLLCFFFCFWWWWCCCRWWLKAVPVVAMRKVGGGALFFPFCSFLVFVSSLLLSSHFLSLFYVLLFRSSFSPLCLYFSLCLRPLFLNNHPPARPLLDLPLFFTSFVSFSLYHPLYFKLFPQPSLHVFLSPLFSLSLVLSRKLFNVLSKTLLQIAPPFRSPYSRIYKGKMGESTLPCPIASKG